MLLGAGAAVAARDYSQRCPLHYAGSSPEVTQLLLDFGADPEAKARHGSHGSRRGVLFVITCNACPSTSVVPHGETQCLTRGDVA